MKFGTYIYQAQKMNSNNFGDCLTFHIAPPAGLSTPLVYDQIFAKVTSSHSQLYFVFVKNEQMLACKYATLRWLTYFKVWLYTLGLGLISALEL